jgi:hypothetical protein
MIEPHVHHQHKRPPLIICVAFIAYMITKHKLAMLILNVECLYLNVRNQLLLTLRKTTTPPNCMGCESHKIVGDPHPMDRRRGKDKAVLCRRMMPTVPINPNRVKPPKMRFNRRIVSCACSGLVQLRQESVVPEWCPRRNNETL